MSDQIPLHISSFFTQDNRSVERSYLYIFFLPVEQIFHWGSQPLKAFRSIHFGNRKTKSEIQGALPDW